MGCTKYSRVYRCMGTYRCVVAYRCTEGVQMYGGVYRCIRHRDIRWDIWDVHRYRGHTDVLG